MMMNKLLIVLAGLCLFICCNSNVNRKLCSNEEGLNSNIIIEYDPLIRFYGDTITDDSLKNVYFEYVISSDTLDIRFVLFEKDSISIWSNDRVIYQSELTTNWSTALADVFVMKNSKGELGRFILQDTISKYDIIYKKGFRFLDIYKDSSIYYLKFNNSWNRYY